MLVGRAGDLSRQPLGKQAEKKGLMLRESVGEDLEHLERDREIHTDPDETRRRRTIKLHKEKGSWGFTIQTYGIKNKKNNEVEVMTYVDYVELSGSAGVAGMRRGDVILSVNGESVEGSTHTYLIQKIRDSKDTMRLVVLFEDCCRKVELYERFIKLKQVLRLKLSELQHLEAKEKALLEVRGIKRLAEVRQSIRSSCSSEWDRYSMIASQHTIENTSSRFYRKDTESLTDSTDFDLDSEDFENFNNSFSDDSDAFQTSSSIDLPCMVKSGKPDSASNQSVTSLSLESNSCDHAEPKCNKGDNPFPHLSCDQIEEKDLCTPQKRFVNGILINDRDEVTKL